MKTKRIISLILAAILSLGLFGCSKGGGDLGVDGASGNTSADTTAAPADESTPEETHEADESLPAVWTENSSVSENMFVYFYNSFYRYFVESYSDGLDTIGLDTTKSLSSQKYSDELTWQAYITIQVYDQLVELMAMADAATEAGLVLDEEDEKTVASQLSSFENAAASSGYTVKEYLEELYGKGVSLDVIEKSVRLRLLANKYYEYLQEGYTFTEEECIAHYSENESQYLYFDCIRITVPAEDAEALSSATGEIEFVDLMREILTKNDFFGDYDRFAEGIEEQILDKYITRACCADTGSVGEWVLEEGRQPYDIHTKEESSGKVTVTMVLPTDSIGAVSSVAYRDDVNTKNFYFIIFPDGEGVEGITKANTIYQNYEEDPSEERFLTLSSRYSGSVANDISYGTLEDSINDWVFAPERVAGDCSALETSNGGIMVYMLEEGEASWIVSVKEDLSALSLESDTKKAIETYPAEFNSDFVYNVTEVTVNTAEE